MESLAMLKHTEFEWNGSTYSSLSRTMGPSPEGLQAYADPLHIMMELAPSGFPAHKDVRDGLSLLHHKWAVLGVKKDENAGDLLRRLNEAADHFRILTKHIYLLRVGQIETEYPDVNKLIAMVVLPARQHSGALAVPPSPLTADDAAGPRNPQRLTASDVEGLFAEAMGTEEEGEDDDDDSDDDVQIIEETKPDDDTKTNSKKRPREDDSVDDVVEVSSWCRCPECRKDQGSLFLSFVDPPSTTKQPTPKPPSTTKPAAAPLPEPPQKTTSPAPLPEPPQKTPIPIPNPRKGGQKADTLNAGSVKPRFRLTNKTKHDDVIVKPKSVKTPKGVKKPKGGKTTEPKKQKTPQDDVIVMPVRIETHKATDGRGADSYLLQSSKKGAYVAGQSASRTKNFEMNVMILKGLVEDGSITTKSDAKKWLASKS